MLVSSSVLLLNTKSLAECYSALTMLDYSSDNLDEITDNFQMVIDNVVDGSITYAIRDSQIDEINIKKDDYMSFINGKIVASNSSKIEAVKALFNNVEDIEDKEVITLIYGKDVTDEEKNQVIQFLSTSFPSIEVGGIDGLQDIYSFIISIE